MGLINLLEETINELTYHSKTEHDVLWVGTKDGKYSMAWTDACDLLNKTYNNGYGGAEIRQNLVVVGSGWWLERHEYDGSEWWEYKECPQVQVETSPLTTIEDNWNTRNY